MERLGGKKSLTQVVTTCNTHLMPPGCPVVLSLIHVLSQVDGAVSKCSSCHSDQSPAVQSGVLSSLAFQCAVHSQHQRSPCPLLTPSGHTGPTESRSDNDQSLASYSYQATVSEDSSTKKILRIDKCKHALVLLAKCTLKFLLAR